MRNITNIVVFPIWQCVMNINFVLLVFYHFPSGKNLDALKCLSKH